jgi:carboxymethylenebutenolidase
MRCHVSLPAAKRPHPGVVVCMHAPGVDAFIQGVDERLAESGFAVVAPDLYHRQGPIGPNPLEHMGRLRDDEIVRDLETALAHLRGLGGADPSRCAVVGFCMGGRLSYLFASHDAALRAAVVFYGGNIMVPWGDSPTPFERSASIECPVLGLFGNEDQNPSPDDVAKIEAELTRLGKPHEFHGYAGAGHAFLNQARPSYHEEAATDAWGRCVAWLHEHTA